MFIFTLRSGCVLHESTRLCVALGASGRSRFRLGRGRRSGSGARYRTLHFGGFGVLVFLTDFSAALEMTSGAFLPAFALGHQVREVLEEVV